MNWKENFEKLRRWIDDEQEDKIPERIENAHKAKSESEIFLQKLKDEIEGLLKKEITRIPNTNKAYIPQRFVVHISEMAYESLSDGKRGFFEQGLSAIILESAKDLAGNLKLTAGKIGVKISPDGTLEEDEMDVKAFSEDKKETMATVQFLVQKESLGETVQKENLSEVAEKPSTPKYQGTVEDLGTIEDFDTFAGLLFRVEIWKNGKKINELPIIQSTTIIGRDDGQGTANIRLKTDNRKISSKHSEIKFEDKDEIWVKALHKNPTYVSGKIIRDGQKAKLGEPSEITIYDFVLKIVN